MQLVDITKNNWENVVSLTTNEDGSHTLIEAFVASNAYSIVQSVYEKGWTIKAIENDGALVGFAMYGLDEEKNVYELCRFMIGHRHQGKGYGKKALSLIVREMKECFSCSTIYLSTQPNNARGKHLYEQFGFVKTGDVWDGEEVYRLEF